MSGPLVRRDGTAIYSPQEHAEREAAILVRAGEQFDAATARYVQQSEREVADLNKSMALLDREPLDTLSADDQARAAARREFVREDVERLPATALADRINATLAADDTVLMVLYERYGQDHASRSQAPLRAALDALRAALKMDVRHEETRAIEAKLRAAKSLPAAVSAVRRGVDGSNERLVAGLRRQFSV